MIFSALSRTWDAGGIQNERVSDVTEPLATGIIALPLGFAFSQKQFSEMMQIWGLVPEKDTDKIYSISCGGFVRKKDAEQLHTTTAQHKAELSAAIAADLTGDGFICDMFRCELDNYEYSYTMDLSDTLDALGYTAEEIKADKRLLHGLEKACKEILKKRLTRFRWSSITRRRVAVADNFDSKDFAPMVVGFLGELDFIRFFRYI